MPARLIASIAISSITPGPLSSIEPRPQIFPSLTMPENGGTSHSLGLAGTTSMWLSRMIDLLCLPIPRSRAATIPRPFCGSQVVAGIPSVRNFSLSIRAAPSSLPGGLVVSIWMYFERRSVASCVTRSQFIACGGGACVTPRDSAGRILGEGDADAAQAGPEIAIAARKHAMAIATGTRAAKLNLSITP